MILSISLIAVIIILDQLTKFVVVANIPLHGHVPFLEGFVRFTYVQNEGAAFGMFSEHRWVFLVLSTIGIIALCYVLWKYGREHKVMQISLSFLIGGGIGNMIDRIFRIGESGHGFVVDFIEFQFVDFAVFNVADSFITIGAVIFAWYVIKDEVIDGMIKKKHEENASDN